MDVEFQRQILELASNHRQESEMLDRCLNQYEVARASLICEGAKLVQLVYRATDEIVPNFSQYDDNVDKAKRIIETAQSLNMSKMDVINAFNNIVVVLREHGWYESDN